jgi:26S proteasome regulatory subunit N1
MAADDEKKPTAADKGKGKAADGEADPKQVQKDKDGKPIDDKKGAPAVGMSPCRTTVPPAPCGTCC